MRFQVVGEKRHWQFIRDAHLSLISLFNYLNSQICGSSLMAWTNINRVFLPLLIELRKKKVIIHLRAQAILLWLSFITIYGKVVIFCWVVCRVTIKKNLFLYRFLFIFSINNHSLIGSFLIGFWNTLIGSKYWLKVSFLNSVGFNVKISLKINLLNSW